MDLGRPDFRHSERRQAAAATAQPALDDPALRPNDLSSNPPQTDDFRRIAPILERVRFA
jgi:hypothetical protein